MTETEFISSLSRLLKEPLPGAEAQLRLAPAGRELRDHQQYTASSVLIVLFQREGNWFFPLIHRVEDGLVHSGQIALPGGRNEKGETSEEAALREAEEEIGISLDQIIICGRLSPLPVPVSGYLIQPVVAMMNHIPRWDPNPSEVQSVHEIAISNLLDSDAITTMELVRHPTIREVPAFAFGELKVWGATAMILSELRELLQSDEFTFLHDE